MSIAAPPPPTQAAIPRGIEIARVVSLANRPKVDLRMRITPYLFVTPYVIVTLTFFVYPLVYATILAFYQTNGPSRRVFVGLSNFSFVLSDPDFHKALWNTSIFAVCSILVQLPLSLGLAMLLSAKDDRLKSLFRLAIFAPNLVGQVFVGVLFVMLFTPRYGLFNIFLFKLVGWGLEEKWLSDPHLVMPAIVLASLWMYVGFNMIYFLAALQNVDQGLVEAARIDGAGPRTIFLHVTIPAIMPVATFVIVTFEVIWRLGWMDTYKALLIPGCVSAFGIFLFRQAIMQVPDDLLEAGRIDGCGEFRIYLSLVMPLVRPMSGAFCLISFLGAWNSFLAPNIYLQTQSKLTLPVVLNQYVSEYSQQYGVFLAGTLLAIIPPALLFLALQREFIKGLTSGAVKQ